MKRRITAIPQDSHFRSNNGPFECTNNLAVPKEYVGEVIGGSGNTIMRLQEENGRKVRFNTGKDYSSKVCNYEQPFSSSKKVYSENITMEMSLIEIIICNNLKYHDTTISLNPISHETLYWVEQVETLRVAL